MYTSTLYILLYSHTFFIRLTLRRHYFYRINFRFEVVSLDLVALIAAIKRVTLISRGRETYIEKYR
jgi:hypothetical protein